MIRNRMMKEDVMAENCGSRILLWGEVKLQLRVWKVPLKMFKISNIK